MDMNRTRSLIAGTALFAMLAVFGLLLFLLPSTAEAQSVTMTANASSVPPNTPAFISWSSQNATSCTAYYTIAGQSKTYWTERLQGENLRVGPLTASTLFEVECTGSGPTARSSVNVAVVAPKPSVTLRANATSVPPNTPAYISWTSENATACTSYYTLAGQSRTTWTNWLQATDVKIGPLSSNITVEVECSSAGGSAKESIVITIASTAPPPPPPPPSGLTLTLSASTT